jgi:hypothetical protein
LQLHLVLKKIFYIQQMQNKLLKYFLSLGSYLSMQHHSSRLPFRCRYLQQYHPQLLEHMCSYRAAMQVFYGSVIFNMHAWLQQSFTCHSCGKPGFVLNKDFKGVINHVSTFTNSANCSAGLIRSIAVVLDLTTSLFNSLLPG